MSAPWPLTGSDLLTQVRYIVWEYEGAKHGHRVVVNPRDLGGRTLSGLTWKTYSRDFLRLPKGELCPVEQFDALTLDDVIAVMLELFAMRTNLWRIADDRLRFAVLDYAIHAGADDAIPALQRALRIADDGIFGRQTDHALTHHADPDYLRERVMDERYQKAARVVVRQPSQLGFLHGWLIRYGRVLTWRAAVAVALVILSAALATAQDGQELPNGTPRSSWGHSVPTPVGR